MPSVKVLRRATSVGKYPERWCSIMKLGNVFVIVDLLRVFYGKTYRKIINLLQ